MILRRGAILKLPERLDCSEHAGKFGSLGTQQARSTAFTKLDVLVDPYHRGTPDSTDSQIHCLT
jgi:hypothetical protein